MKGANTNLHFLLLQGWWFTQFEIYTISIDPYKHLCFSLVFCLKHPKTTTKGPSLADLPPRMETPAVDMHRNLVFFREGSNW